MLSAGPKSSDACRSLKWCMASWRLAVFTSHALLFMVRPSLPPSAGGCSRYSPCRKSPGPCMRGPWEEPPTGNTANWSEREELFPVVGERSPTWARAKPEGCARPAGAHLVNCTNSLCCTPLRISPSISSWSLVFSYSLPPTSAVAVPPSHLSHSRCYPQPQTGVPLPEGKARGMVGWRCFIGSELHALSTCRFGTSHSF